MGGRNIIPPGAALDLTTYPGALLPNVLLPATTPERGAVDGFAPRLVFPDKNPSEQAS